MAAWWKTYGKAILAAAFFVFTAAQAGLSDGHLTAVEDVQIGIAGLTAFNVFIVPAHPGWPWAKTTVAVGGAVLNALLTLLLGGGITAGDIPELVIAALTALGVAVAPARSMLTQPPVGHRALP